MQPPKYPQDVSKDQKIWLLYFFACKTRLKLSIEKEIWEFEGQSTREEAVTQRKRHRHLEALLTLWLTYRVKKIISEKFQNNWKLSNSYPSNLWIKDEITKKIRKKIVGIKAAFKGKLITLNVIIENTKYLRKK